MSRPAHRLDILIVDDRRDNADSISRLLTLRAPTITQRVAYSSAKAEPLLELRPRIVLADYIMVGENGTEIIASAKRIDPSCFGIIMTALSDAEVKEQADRCGVDLVVEKAITTEFVDFLIERLTRESA